MNEADQKLLEYFNYEHLPERLKQVSYQFSILSEHIILTIEPGDQRTQALRKLLESKDCAVRAAL